MMYMCVYCSYRQAARRTRVYVMPAGRARSATMRPILVPLSRARTTVPVCHTRMEPSLAPARRLSQEDFAKLRREVLSLFRHCKHLNFVGCVAQWLERRSLTGELCLASARSAADV